MEQTPLDNKHYSLLSVIVKCMGNTIDLMKTCYSEHIMPVPWPFITLRVHSNKIGLACC